MKCCPFFWTTGARCSSAFKPDLCPTWQITVSRVFPQNCWARSSEIGLRCRWKTRNATLKEGKVTFFINYPSFFLFFFELNLFRSHTNLHSLPTDLCNNEQLKYICVRSVLRPCNTTRHIYVVLFMPFSWLYPRLWLVLDWKLVNKGLDRCISSYSSICHSTPPVHKSKHQTEI